MENHYSFGPKLKKHLLEKSFPIFFDRGQQGGD